jgi:hypothetical protein
MNEINNNQKLQFVYKILDELSHYHLVSKEDIEKAKMFTGHILDLFTPDMK